jgi:intracellular multiplication protein IcmJ
LALPVPHKVLCPNKPYPITMTESSAASSSVKPHPALGKNFSQRGLAPLSLSTKAVVWGDASGLGLEPLPAEDHTADLRNKVVRQHGNRCMFCGLESLSNEVHNVNHNHRDATPENLRLADAICHRWQHLGELGAGNGVLVYLPQLAARDVSHLLRTVLVGLACGDAAFERDAKTLLNWIASHREYVEIAWGSSNPRVFATALQRLNQAEGGVWEGASGGIFEGLALVINPDVLSKSTAVWASELSAEQQPADWQKVYHDVMHAPT